MNAAYIAGFIDADGCISVNYRVVGRTATGKQITNRSVYFNVSVIVVQKNERVVRMLFDQYGGGYNITVRGDRRYFRWSASGKAAVRVLKDILPYIIDKKEQAELALQAAEHQASCGRGRYRAGCEGTQPLSENDLRFRKDIWLRVKELNTCHKLCAAATTKSSDPETGSDSLTPVVISGGAAKAPIAAVLAM